MISSLTRAVFGVAVALALLHPVTTPAAPEELAAPEGPAAPGDLLTEFGGFGTNGKLTGLGLQASDAALDPQGRLVIVGSHKDTHTFAVERRSGFKMNTVSANQVVIDPAQAAFGAAAGGVAVAENGKIVLVGTVHVNGKSNLAVARFNADLSVDTSFDADGATWVSFNNRNNSGYAGVVQPDGKIVAVGHCETGDTSSQWCVARFNVDGVLDSTFDGDGLKLISFAENIGGAYAVALQPDGQIVIGGTVLDGNFDMGVVRLNPDGSFDNTFDNDGKANIGVNGDDFFKSMALAPEGKIVTVGSSISDTSEMKIVRFLANGQPDPTFDGDGRLETKLPVLQGGSKLADVVVRPDGRIVLGGLNRRTGELDRFFLARLMVNGAFDPSFSGDGLVFTDFSPTAVNLQALVLQPDGLVIALGSQQAARYRSTGELDSGGIYPVSFSPEARSAEAQALGLQADGRLVAAGMVQVGSLYDMAIARFDNPAAAGLDFSYGNRSLPDGRSVYGFGADERLNALAVQPDGKTVVVGQTKTGGNGNFLLARFTADGKPDPACTIFGFNALDFGHGDDTANAVAIDAAGKIYVAGTVQGPITVDYGVVRFNPDCTLDTSYGVPGNNLPRVDVGLTDVLAGMVLQPDGKVVLGGIVGTNIVLTRVNAEATSVDTSFGTNGYTTFDTGATEVPTRMAQQKDGKLVISGWRYDGNTTDFLAARFTPDGVLDPNFSGDGWATIDFSAAGGGSDNAYGLAVRGDNTVAVVGCVDDGSSPGTRFGVAQLTPDGELDASFSGDGKATVQVGADGSDCANAALYVAPDRLVVAGTSYTAGKAVFSLAMLGTSRYLDPDSERKIYLPVVKR